MNEIELIMDFVENHKCSIKSLIGAVNAEIRLLKVDKNTNENYTRDVVYDWIVNLKAKIQKDPETINKMKKQLEDHYAAILEREKEQRDIKKKEDEDIRKKEEAERKLKNAAYEKKQNYQRMIEDDYNKEQHRLSEIERKSKLWDKANKLHKQHPGLPVTQIAREVGYSNVESLYQMLRRHKGWL